MVRALRHQHLRCKQPQCRKHVRCEAFDDTEIARLSAAADSEAGFVSEAEHEDAVPLEEFVAENDDVDLDVSVWGIRVCSAAYRALPG